MSGDSGHFGTPSIQQAAREGAGVMSELSRLLDEIVDGPGINFCMLVSTDGFIVENSTGASDAEEIAGSTVSALLRTLKVIGDDLENGNAEQVLVKYAKGWLVVNSMTSDVILVTSLSSKANMGWVRYALKKNKQKIVERL
jgi:predicted regulator of Ras-like GTPase activity (Roadblock/LC7/MglB family)